MHIYSFVIFCLVRTASSYDSTKVAIKSNQTFTGWCDGPNERGTMTIIWSCLTTVIACTWTILHLNVPGVHDGTWTKFWRKVKWMATTLVFPEFTFAKAVCELQMAIEDLNELSLKQELFDWEVDCGWGCRLLHKLLRPHRCSELRSSSRTSNRVIKDVNSEKPSGTPLLLELKHPAKAWGSVYNNKIKRWTLTHPYFANMGGLVVAPITTHDGSTYPSNYALETFTAHCLVQCCLPNGCNPLDGDTNLSQQEITDRSKADCLVKAATTLQILWMIISVIVRVSRDLPVSQLEICTVAFSSLAIATYITNWAKPKDIECPLAIVKEDSHHSGSCKAYLTRGQSCISLSGEASKSRQSRTSRVLNDSFRLQLHGTVFLTLSYALVLSTIGFGIVHCTAWRSDFPTPVERMLWRVSSVITTTIPLSSVVLMGTVRKFLHLETRRILQRVQSIRGKTTTTHSFTVSRPTCNVLFWKESLLWSSKDGCITEASLSAITELEATLRDLGPQLDCGLIESSSLDYALFWSVWLASRRAYNSLKAEGFVFIDTPNDTGIFHALYSEERSSIKRSADLDYGWNFALRLLCLAPDIVRVSELRWAKADRLATSVNYVYTWLSGTLYVTARLTILILAFSALRKQDERLYIDTWAS